MLFDFIKAVILGVVEGLTEFIPVSSTGHLLLMQRFFGFSDDDFGKSFAVLIQFGAILALLSIYSVRLWPVSYTHLDVYKRQFLALHRLPLHLTMLGPPPRHSLPPVQAPVAARMQRPSGRSRLGPRLRPSVVRLPLRQAGPLVPLVPRQRMLFLPLRQCRAPAVRSRRLARVRPHRDDRACKANP